MKQQFKVLDTWHHFQVLLDLTQSWTWTAPAKASSWIHCSASLLLRSTADCFIYSSANIPFAVFFFNLPLVSKNFKPISYGNKNRETNVLLTFLYILQETTFPFDIQLSPQILPLEMQPLSFYFILLRRDGFAQQEKFVLPRNFSHYEQHSEVSQSTFQHFKCIVGF